MNQKNVVIVGLGKSGVSALNFFVQGGAKVQAFDNKMSLDNDLCQRFPSVRFYFGQNPTGEEEADIVVMSPGISLDLDFVKRFMQRDIEVTGDIEIAYRNAPARFIAITGTNGKTTSTTLTGEIFRSFYERVCVVGNIGHPILDELAFFDQNTYVIAELSSFQLESIRSYHPHIAAILNITPDHLNRHKTMENYIAAKFRVFENQTSEDFLVLNYDDEILRKTKANLSSQRIYFSRKISLTKGVFVCEDQIVSTLKGSLEQVMPIQEVGLIGNHNLENVLACIAIALLSGIDLLTIRSVVRNFRGVEHRIEYVCEKNNVIYLNDSKATNPDSAIKAVEAISEPIILIAGGLDKKADFTSLIHSFKNKVKHLILLGETKHIIEDQAKRMGFLAVSKVDTMNEAVRLAAKTASAGDTVLLSPACASWDMYDSYEVRGRDFKTHVNNL